MPDIHLQLSKPQTPFLRPFSPRPALAAGARRNPHRDTGTSSLRGMCDEDTVSVPEGPFNSNGETCTVAGQGCVIRVVDEGVERVGLEC
jgi:hypothetical protein